MRVLNNTLLLRVNATRPKIYRWEISRLDFPRLDFLRDNNLFDITCAFLILNTRFTAPTVHRNSPIERNVLSLDNHYDLTYADNFE